MKRLLTMLALAVAAAIGCTAQVTLGYCLGRADNNYPLIRRYGLVDKSLDIDLSDISKAWLPHVEAYGQLTAQNTVPSFPAALSGVMSQMGQELNGLGKIQYKVGVDLSQTIWDGGASAVNRREGRAEAELARARLDVEMYAMHEKVIDLYFATLLVDEQMAQMANAIRLVEANLALLRAMKTDGVAMQSDIDMAEAKLLTMNQQLTEARSARKGYVGLLEIYIDESLEGKSFEKPAAEMPADYVSRRPELALFDAQRRLDQVKLDAVDVSLRPRVGLFAQAYYGYPGMDYFKSMTSRRLSFNVLAGVKVSWSVDALYHKKNSRARVALADAGVDADREMFLFGTRMQSRSQTEAIEGMRKVMTDDVRIVELRTNVRMAAEAQLRNGVINATDLLDKITDENQAQLTARFHEMKLLQNIYRLKYTLNR